jgi:acetyl esterase/lipase
MKIIIVIATVLVAAACVDASAAPDRAARRAARKAAVKEALKDALFEATELDERVILFDGDFPGVETSRDVAYGADPAQTLDVYLPAPSRRASPVGIIVMVHGGGWRRGDKRARGVVQHKVEAWVADGMRRGLAFVSVNYRMTPPDPHVEAQDVAAAVAFVQQQAPSWGADPARVVLMGHSAGAHLVSLVAVEPTYLAAAGARPVRGVVSLDSGSIDVEETMSRRHFSLYDEPFGKDPTFWAQVSPLARLKARAAGPLPPFLMVCSTTRRDACPQAKRFAAAATRLQGRVDVLPVDLDHAHINLDLGLASPYTADVERFLAAVGLHELTPTPPTPTPSTPEPPVTP